MSVRPSGPIIETQMTLQLIIQVLQSSNKFKNPSLIYIPGAKQNNLTTLEFLKSAYHLMRAGVLAVTRLLSFGGIRLSGLPASLAELHRRLFALPPRGTAVSTLPSDTLGSAT